MAKITTLDILSILPFEEHFKKELLEKYPTMSQDQQCAVEDIIWDTYDIVCALKLDENLSLAQERLKRGQEEADEEWYNRVKAQTERQLLSELQKTITTVDLSEAREELQKLIGPK